MHSRYGLLTAPAVIYLLLAFAAPMTLLSASSLWIDGGFSLANYGRYLGDSYYLGVIWNSIRLGLIASVVTLLVAFPAAFAIARCRPRVQGPVLALILIPLTVGTIVKAFGWTIVFRRAGIVNQVLLGLGLVESPPQWLFTPTAFYIGIVNMFLPYMLLPLFSTVRMIDARLPEAAATLGAGPLFRFFHLILPLTFPGIVSGIALVFSLSISSYAGPLLLIGDRYPTMTTTIARSFLALGDHRLGSTMAVLLLIIAAAVVSLAGRLDRKKAGR